jgi:hypothetical protein
MHPVGYKHRQDPQKVIVTLFIVILYWGIPQEIEKQLYRNWQTTAMFLLFILY